MQIQQLRTTSVLERDEARARDRGPGVLPREVLSLLVRRGTVSSWYLIARRVLQYQITIY